MNSFHMVEDERPNYVRVVYQPYRSNPDDCQNEEKDADGRIAAG